MTLANIPGEWIMGAPCGTVDPDLFKPRSKVPLSERFWMRVEQSGDCWLWTGAHDVYGYGKFYYSPRRHSALAHRWAYEYMVGPIPEGLVLDHLCRTRDCVNPEHLDPVPLGINTMRGLGVGPLNAAKTACKRGHDFTDENTYHAPSGGRRCRECARMYDRSERRVEAQKRRRAAK